MGLPQLDINFKTLAQQTISKSKRGVVALILKDTAKFTETITDELEIPSALSEANKKLVKEVLKGYVSRPSIILYTVANEDTLDNALDFFETEEFTLLVAPQHTEAAEVTKVTEFITRMEKEVRYRVRALVSNKKTDNKQIDNVTAKEVMIGADTVEEASLLCRLAGVWEGCPLNQAVTYAVIPELTGCEKLTRKVANSRIDAGEIILVKEMGKIRVGADRTSMTTADLYTKDIFESIQAVKTSNLVHNDLRRLMVEGYIGKIPNIYANKCNLITKVTEYLQELEKEGLLENISVGIDIAKQKAYLKTIGKDVASMTEQQIKEANTKKKVFIQIKFDINEAMKDIDIDIEV